jgi:nucleotidyltransferase/DNA polymerase involved in DNA repair
VTRQTTRQVAIDEALAIYQTALPLLQRAWRHGEPVRLLGVGGQHLIPPPTQRSTQLPLC